MSLQKKIKDGKQAAVDKLLRYLRDDDDPKVIALLTTIFDFDHLLELAKVVEKEKAAEVETS